MKKVLFPIFVVFGILLMYFLFQNDIKDKENAPQLFFKDQVSLKIKKISFERNQLYLNDTLYNAGGISGYSKVHSNNVTTELLNIQPPFLILKEANNDTLKIIKKDSLFYLLVTKEQDYVKRLSNE